MSELEQLRDELNRLKNARKNATKKRRETHPLLSVELTPLTIHTLRTLAIESDVSMGRWLVRMLEAKAEKHGITLPEPATEPEPVSQPVTTTPTTSKTLQELADNWDTME